MLKLLQICKNRKILKPQYFNLSYNQDLKGSRQAVLAVYIIKDGKIIRSETGATTLKD